MSEEEANKVLEELNEVRPEVLNEKAKRLYIAIIKIADERDYYKKEHNRLQEENNQLKLELQYALNTNNKDILKHWRKK